MSQLKLTIVGDPTPLRNATRVAEKSLRSLLTNANKTSAGINKAFGAVGLGIGFASLTNGLKQATKAASDDRKSQGLLANALEKTVGASASAVAGAEAYIKKTQLQTAVLDDELRPALATAVRATGSLTDGQRLLDIALDVSAETGKGLNLVTKSIARAQQGQLGGLQKLIPGLKATDDIMGDLEKKYQGTAEKAANLDPYNRLNIIFNDIQETIGAQLLPVLEEFSTYLATTEGQRNLTQIVDLFVAIGKAISVVAKFLIDNIALVKAVTAAVITAKVSWIVLGGAVRLYTALTGNAIVATKLLKGALITTGIGAIAVLVGTLADAWINATDAQEDYTEGQPSDVYIPTTNPYQEELDRNIKATKDKAIKAADDVKKALAQKIEGIKKTAENFRDAIGLAFGTFGKDENTIFNVDVIIAKLKRVVEAAKGFAENIKKLRKAKADESVISEIVGMGPAQGNIVAKGLLGSGKLAEYLTLRKSLYNTGASVGAEASMGTQNTYEININKANVSAEEIIRAIRSYEKQSGRKYFVK